MQCNKEIIKYPTPRAPCHLLLLFVCVCAERGCLFLYLNAFHFYVAELEQTQWSEETSRVESSQESQVAPRGELLQPSTLSSS